MKDIKLNYSESSISESLYIQYIEKYKLKLPIEYKNFILAQNGGTPNTTSYIDNNDNEFHITLFYCVRLEERHLLDTLDEIMSSTTIIENSQIVDDELPKHLYPFGQDAGGSAYCISMQESDYGAIYKFYWDGSDMRFVCNSFEEFFDGLE